MTLQTTTKQQNVHAYSFEAIQKGEYTKKVLINFAHLEQLNPSPFSNSTIHIGIYDYGIKLTTFKITDIDGTIKLLEEVNQNQLSQYGLSILKKAIIQIYVTVYEPEFLPYNFIILHFELDATKLDLTTSYTSLSGIFRMLVDYWLTFNGIFGKEYKNQFSSPIFYKISYDVTLKPTLEQIMNDLGQYLQKKDVQKYVDTSNKLQQYFLFDKFEYSQISLLKIQDNYNILATMPGSRSDFATICSLEPSNFEIKGTNPFFVNPMFGSFPTIFLQYLLLTSPIYWGRVARQKTTDILTKINDLKIKYKTTDYLDSNNEDEFLKIYDLDNELNFLLSELKDLKNVSKIFESWFLTNPEVIDRSIVLGTYVKNNHKLFESRIENSYVKICKSSFDYMMEETEKNIQELQDSLMLIKQRIEFLQKNRDNKTKNNQNTILIITAIISGIFATVVGIDVISRWINGT